MTKGDKAGAKEEQPVDQKRDEEAEKPVAAAKASEKATEEKGADAKKPWWMPKDSTGEAQKETPAKPSTPAPSPKKVEAGEENSASEEQQKNATKPAAVVAASEKAEKTKKAAAKKPWWMPKDETAEAKEEEPAKEKEEEVEKPSATTSASKKEDAEKQVQEKKPWWMAKGMKAKATEDEPAEDEEEEEKTGKEVNKPSTTTIAPKKAKATEEEPAEEEEEEKTGQEVNKPSTTTIAPKKGDEKKEVNTPWWMPKSSSEQSNATKSEDEKARAEKAAKDDKGETPFFKMSSSAKDPQQGEAANNTKDEVVAHKAAKDAEEEALANGQEAQEKLQGEKNGTMEAEKGEEEKGKDEEKEPGRGFFKKGWRKPGQKWNADQVSIFGTHLPFSGATARAGSGILIAALVSGAVFALARGSRYHGGPSAAAAREWRGVIDRPTRLSADEDLAGEEECLAQMEEGSESDGGASEAEPSSARPLLASTQYSRL